MSGEAVKGNIVHLIDFVVAEKIALLKTATKPYA
jgi:hypothetical protein